MARAARRRQTGSATRRTTRQQSGRRTQHLLWLLGGAFLLAIASLLALAYYRESIAPWRAAVVRVDQQVVDMAQYVRRLRLAKAESELRGQVFNPSVEPMATLAALQEEAMLLLWASQDGVIAEGAAVDAELQRWLAAQVGVEPGADGQFEAAAAARIEARYLTLRTETGLDRADFQRLAKASVLRQGLRQKLAESVPTEAPQAQVEVMVAGSRETAQQALQRLGDGEEWAAVAQALQGSGTAPQGLSIQEWLPQGVVGEDFDRVVFGLPPGQASQPVPVSSGFLVVRVDERQEDRSLPGGGAAAQVHASIIAVADEEAAQQVTQRLGAGEAFDSLAREMSLDVGSREAGGGHRLGASWGARAGVRPAGLWLGHRREGGTRWQR